MQLPNFERLRDNPLDLVVVDFETNLIDASGNVDIIWLIGWMWIENNERKYMQVKWEDGISPTNLASLLTNVHTRAEIKQRQVDIKLSHLCHIIKEKISAFHNAGFDKRRLDELGIFVPRYIDTMMLMYNVMPPSVLLENVGDEDNLRLYSLKELGRRGLCSAKDDKPDFDVFDPRLPEYNVGDLNATMDLCERYLPSLVADKDLFNCFIKVQMPAIETAMIMSRRGIHIPDDNLDELILESEGVVREALKVMHRYLPVIPNPNKPKEYRKEKEERETCDELDELTWDKLGKWLYAGKSRGLYLYREIIEFNPASSTHKRYALKRLFNWESDKRTKGGESSVDKHALNKLQEEIHHPFVHALLEHSTYNKLLGNFLVPWKDNRDVDNRIHPSFIAVGTATGRYSSRNPNFQNVPSSIKKAIVAQEGNVIVYIDLSQAELRILAYYMAIVLNDYQLWNVYARDEDIHSVNMKLMGITEPSKRVIAKRAIFLKIYGGGTSAMARSCDISDAEAKYYLKKFDSVIPGITALANAVKDAIASSDGGVIRSLQGRKIVYPHYLKYLHAAGYGSSGYKKERAFRQYFNSIFQGGNFDISTMLGWKVLPYALECGGFPIIQVHDSFVFEVPLPSAGWFCDILHDAFNDNEILEGLPIRAMPGYGNSWAEAEEDAKRREDETKEKS